MIMRCRGGVKSFQNAIILNHLPLKIRDEFLLIVASCCTLSMIFAAEKRWGRRKSRRKLLLMISLVRTD